MEHEDLLIEESEFYEKSDRIRDLGFEEMNMICDETPQIGSILAPR